jgi:uncharacterized protein
MDSVFVDTSAYYAIFDKSDKNHVKAKRFLETNILPLFTSNLVVIEIVNLVNAREGHEEALKIGKKFYEENLTAIVNVTSEDEKRAWQIFKRYSDKDFSLTDCTSFALMERLGTKKSFAFDIHFIQYGKLTVLP